MQSSYYIEIRSYFYYFEVHFLKINIKLNDDSLYISYSIVGLSMLSNHLQCLSDHYAKHTILSDEVPFSIVDL